MAYKPPDPLLSLFLSSLPSPSPLEQARSAGESITVGTFQPGAFPAQAQAVLDEELERERLRKLREEQLQAEVNAAEREFALEEERVLSEQERASKKFGMEEMGMYAGLVSAMFEKTGDYALAVEWADTLTGKKPHDPKMAQKVMAATQAKQLADQQATDRTALLSIMAEMGKTTEGSYFLNELMKKHPEIENTLLSALGVDAKKLPQQDVPIATNRPVRPLPSAKPEVAPPPLTGQPKVGLSQMFAALSGKTELPLPVQDQQIIRQEIDKAKTKEELLAVTDRLLQKYPASIQFITELVAPKIVAPRE